MGDLLATGGHDDVGRLPALVTGADHVPVALPPEPVHPNAGADRQLESAGVRVKVVGHLVLGREGQAVPGERHPRKAVELGRGEQAQRVPPLPPGIADPLVRVEDDEVAALSGQVPPQGKSRLTTADDDSVDDLDEGLVLLSGHAATSCSVRVLWALIIVRTDPRLGWRTRRRGR